MQEEQRVKGAVMGRLRWDSKSRKQRAGEGGDERWGWRGVGPPEGWEGCAALLEVSEFHLAWGTHGKSGKGKKSMRQDRENKSIHGRCHSFCRRCTQAV